MKLNEGDGLIKNKNYKKCKYGEKKNFILLLYYHTAKNKQFYLIRNC